MLATGSMLHPAGTHDVETAAQAVEALRPVACAGASVLFALGVIGVGFIAIPIMTAGAAYDLGQALNWKNCSLHATPRTAKKFYFAVAAFTAVAVGLNFLGLNPMNARMVRHRSGVFDAAAPVLIMLMTNNRRIMGHKTCSAGRPRVRSSWRTSSCRAVAGFACCGTHPGSVPTNRSSQNPAARLE